MIIGIDIDDTITKTTENATRILKRNCKYKDVVDYHNIDKKEFLEFVNDNIGEILGSVELKENVVEVLNNLKKKGNKIIFVTARGDLTKDICGISCAFLDRWKIPYDKVIYFKNSKVDTVLNEGIEIFIDDKENVLDEIKDAGIKTLRMCNKDEQSNHQVVKSWMEVQEILETLEVNNE